MTVFDSLQRASFDGVEFPIEEVSLKGGIRDHVHEYPHRDGGKTEKLGRRLYVVRFMTRFEANLPGYPNLWPTSLRTLREKFEAKTIGQLVIPTVGVMNAYCFDWEQVARMEESLSGERVPLVFREEQQDDLDAIAAFVNEGAQTGMAAQIATVDEEDAANPVIQPDLLTSLDNAVQSVLAIRDQADIYGSQLESKLLLVANTCSDIDRSLTDPTASRVIDALHNLWDSALTALKDLQNQKSDLQTFTVPVLMSILEVSTKLYGDTSHQMELLQMNPIDDAFAIPANTPIRYYPAA